MAEEATTRDARRRRRILQQGSDRLAFITGRIQTLPDSTPSSQPDPNTALPSTVHDSDSTSQNPEPYNNTVIQTPPETEISTIPNSEPEPEPEPVQLPAPAQTNEPERVITPSDITRAINASRVTRFCCSILVVLLVLASYFLRSQFFKTLITFKPLYLVLVTNLTVVIARLFSGEQRSVQRRRTSTASSGGDEYAQLAKMLELCVVAKHVADAVFMDCAVYVVVLVCALSVFRT